MLHLALTLINEDVLTAISLHRIVWVYLLLRKSTTMEEN